jgi:hypothetical protein
MPYAHTICVHTCYCLCLHVRHYAVYQIQGSFSGGQDTKELQLLHGANLHVDVAYQVHILTVTHL